MEDGEGGNTHSLSPKGKEPFLEYTYTYIPIRTYVRTYIEKESAGVALDQ